MYKLAQALNKAKSRLMRGMRSQADGKLTVKKLFARLYMKQYWHRDGFVIDFTLLTYAQILAVFIKKCISVYN